MENSNFHFKFSKIHVTSSSKRIIIISIAMEWNPKRCINFPDFSWRRSHGYLVTCTSRVRKIKRLTVDASNIVADRRRCLPRQIVVMIKRCTFDRSKFHDRSKLIFLRRRTTCGVEKPAYRSILRLFSSPTALPMFFLYNLTNLVSFLRCRPW